MRNDSTRTAGFSDKEQWGDVTLKLFERKEFRDPGDPVFHSSAFSGNEANRLFLRRGNNYRDATLVSGADFREDGRGFVIFDFDSDGWLDLGVVSPNAPRFRILRNRISEIGSNEQASGNFVSISLIGGQKSAVASENLSPRDPFGAKIIVSNGGTKRIFQLQCGEGLSVQNSKQIHIGLGSAKEIEELEVTWPSGKITKRQNIAAGERITIHETPTDQAE